MSSHRHGTVKRWTCSNCNKAEISIHIGDCPTCEHTRCVDCCVKSHAATSAEIEKEDMKEATATKHESSQTQPSMPRPRTGASTVWSLNAGSPWEVVNPLSRETTTLEGSSDDPAWENYSVNERRFGSTTAYSRTVAPNSFASGPAYASEPSRYALVRFFATID